MIQYNNNNQSYNNNINTNGMESFQISLRYQLKDFVSKFVGVECGSTEYLRIIGGCGKLFLLVNQLCELLTQGCRGSQGSQGCRGSQGCQGCRGSQGCRGAWPLS
eukprot:GHVR01049822.1.p1 GENE.GHVR01049822.1~~GHVR01049822.1.p1  ORF type:complete len:122 (+),score=44.60 GHVR01049822.1:54-368(+)